MYCLKKLRNNIEFSKGEYKVVSGRYLIVNERFIIWDYWEGCFRFNCQSGFRIYRSFIKEYFVLILVFKMRNKLVIDVLSKDMLYFMKAYQQIIKNFEFLVFFIVLFEYISVLIDIFCNRNKFILNFIDLRFVEIRVVS